MPIPSPSKKEKQDDFMARCMHALKDEKKPQDQKVAICMSTYRRAKDKKKSQGSNDEPTWDNYQIEDGFILF